MTDEETAYRLTVGEMREKIKAECDKHNDCGECALRAVPSNLRCFTGDAETVKKNYATMFDSAVDDLACHNSTVDHPAHYCYSKYEPKDVIRGWGLNFNLGSAVKYIARAGRKDDIIQDLEKAKKFLEFEIEALKLDRENGSDV